MRTGPSDERRAPDFERIHRVLSRCVHKVCPSDLRPVVEDLVQGAAAQLWARMEAAGQPIEFGSAYLWRVANHAVIDEIRRRRRSVEDLHLDPERTLSADGDASAGERRARIVAGVRACLAEAPADRRAALGLHLQGVRLRDVATALGCAPKRADNLVYRGLAALRECLLGKGLRP
ncbi:MAG: sigma-70 family RNA polymerase sigma factor [Myxococcota bacterium]